MTDPRRPGSPGAPRWWARLSTLVAVIVVAAAQPVMPTPASAGGPPNLFRAVGGESHRPAPGLQRSREVTLALDLARRPGPLEIVFNPFDDAAVPVTLHRAVEPDGAIAWRGRANGEPSSQVLLVVYDGWVNGTANLGTHRFSIRAADSGVLVVSESGPEPIPFGDDQPAPSGGGEQIDPLRDTPPGAAFDSHAVIDVLVVITDDVLATEFSGNQAAATAWASTRIAEFNTALANSAVVARGRLAGMAFPSYAESRPPADIYTDLERLTFHAGEDCDDFATGLQDCDPAGHLDDILTLRDDIGADIVSLVVSDAVDGAGIGWLTCAPGQSCPSKYLVNVARFNTATYFYTMAHEIGHNLGLRHDLANDPDAVEKPTYARGYRVPDEFATIMSYTCTYDALGNCLDYPPEVRILHYSNPDVLFGGKPTGIPIGAPGQADAATHIDNIAATVAAAREATPTPPVGLVDPSQGRWYLRDELGVVSSFFYGAPGDYPFMGDWNCDGIDTPGLYRQSDGFVYLRNTNSFGVADVNFFFGVAGDIPIAGDFDGDGCDTLGIYRPSEGRAYISDTLGSNGGFFVADYSYYFGNPGDKPFTGDFDGDNIDTIGLHRESTGLVYFRNTHSFGVADNQFYFGIPGDRLVAGDWGIIDGIDPPAVFRPAITTFYFRHTNTQGNADAQFTWGQTGWLPVAGVFQPPG